MPEKINITNSKGRDTQVPAESVTPRLVVRWLGEDGRQATNRKLLKGTIDRDIDFLRAQHDDDLAKVGQALIDGDPEIDFETYGSFLEETSRVFVDQHKEVVHKVVHWEVIREPDGTEKERRPRKLSEPNTCSDTPLTWTGKKLPKDQVYNRFVFASKMQILHDSGLTYDFLYEMASDLEKDDSLLLLGGGPKGDEALVFRRGGSSYRGFLEGRTEGKSYALILHLSNMELKKPEPEEEEETA